MPIPRRRESSRRKQYTPLVRQARGQSLVEFTLILPIMLVLLLTVADFGRLFAAGITIESAARAAAEIAAADYLKESDAAAPGSVTADGYARVHTTAWRSVCDEAGRLPNATPATSGQCDGLPTVVCVHDGADPDCAQTYNSSSGIPAQCGAMSLTNAQTGGTETSRYVEVAVCYRFSTVFQLDIPFLGTSLSPLGGDFYVAKTRAFTVADY